MEGGHNWLCSEDIGDSIERQVEDSDFLSLKISALAQSLFDQLQILVNRVTFQMIKCQLLLAERLSRAVAVAAANKYAASKTWLLALVNVILKLGAVCRQLGL